MWMAMDVWNLRLEIAGHSVRGWNSRGMAPIFFGWKDAVLCFSIFGEQETHPKVPQKRKVERTSKNTDSNKTLCLAILCDLLGMVESPFLRLSDLQIGHKKVTNWITWKLEFESTCTLKKLLLHTFFFCGDSISVYSWCKFPIILDSKMVDFFIPQKAWGRSNLKSLSFSDGWHNWHNHHPRVSSILWVGYAWGEGNKILSLLFWGKNI